jgi:AcrR family transcriptional regulator
VGRPRADQITTATPERILGAAETLFADVGYSRAKLAEIAARAGIRRPSLLYHFGSKEALYAATVQRAFGRMREALVDAMQIRGSFEDRLLATVTRYAEFLEAEPHIARIILRQLLDASVSAQASTKTGARLLLEQIVPLVDIVESFVRREGAAIVRPSLPIRAAILQLSSDILLRAASGPLREPLWGSEDHARTLARVSFLDEPRAADAPGDG